MDVFLELKIKEVRTEEERQKQLTHKEKMKKWSRRERKVGHCDLYMFEQADEALGWLICFAFIAG